MGKVRTISTQDLDKSGFPTREGKYLALNVWGDRENPREIDVYMHPIKGLCCWTEDYGGEGNGIDDETQGHSTVGFTGLEFISRIGNLK